MNASPHFAVWLIKKEDYYDSLQRNTSHYRTGRRSGKNADFYTRTLGMRLVKKSVNQDDPGTYHLFYGNHSANPGSSLTFFPWPNAVKGEPGTGEAVNVALQVPEGSDDFWKERLNDHDVDFEEVEVFGKAGIRFEDPDGLELDLIFQGKAKDKVEGVHYEIPYEYAVQGFWGTRLNLTEKEATEHILKELFDFELYEHSGNQYLYKTDAPVGHSVIIEVSEEKRKEWQRHHSSCCFPS